MLNDKIESYKETGKFVTVTPAKYKTEFPYLKEVDSLALANVQLHFQVAFRNRFNKSRKKKNGFPKFKSAKRSKKSYTTNNQRGTVSIIEHTIRLPKVGLVKVKIHRHIANQRKDNLHKISTEIANPYDIVCVESLNMKSLSNKGFGNGKATMDNGCCTLSSAIASNLAKGFTLEESVERAKDYISKALEAMLDLGQGSGPMNHAFDLNGKYSEMKR